MLSGPASLVKHPQRNSTTKDLANLALVLGIPSNDGNVYGISAATLNNNNILKHKIRSHKLIGENQFKEIEELTNKAEEVEEIQREQSPEIVVDDKYQATFQEVWDSLNSESFENDFINQQYEDFKRTQKMGFQLI